MLFARKTRGDLLPLSNLKINSIFLFETAVPGTNYGIDRRLSEVDDL